MARGLVFGEQFGNEVEVADVALDEAVARVITQAGEVFEVAGVGQGIEVDDRLIGLRQPIQDKIAADKAGATGDENHLFISNIEDRILARKVTLPSPAENWRSVACQAE